MKYFKSIVAVFFLFLFSISISAEGTNPGELDEYIRVRPFSQGQKERYTSLIHQISLIQTKIESYYEHLKLNSEADCTLFHGGEKIYCDLYKIQKDGMTYVPLEARRVSLYGRRQKMLYNELAYFKWNGKKIESFYFETRKGYLGTIRVLSRLFYGNSITDQAKAVDEKNPPMSLVVNEVLPTGKGTFSRFAFPNTEKVFNKKNDSIKVNGKTLNLSTIYLRNPDERLRIVTKYLDLLKRLEGRLQWNVHAQNTRRQSELDRVLRDSY